MDTSAQQALPIFSSHERGFSSRPVPGPIEISLEVTHGRQAVLRRPQEVA